MKNYLSDDLKTLKSRYKYTIRDGLCGINNDLNYSVFRWYLEDLKIEENLELFKKQIEKKNQITLMKQNLLLIKYS